MHKQHTRLLELCRKMSNFQLILRSIFFTSLFAVLAQVQGCGDSPGPISQTGPTPGGENVWQDPVCDLVAGTSKVTFTKNFGASYTPRELPVSNTQPQLTHSIVAMSGVANHLLAATENEILLSTNSGCNWGVVASSTDASLKFVDTGGDEVIGWSIQFGDIYSFSVAGGLSFRGNADAGGLKGLGVSSTIEGLLRAIGRTGTVLESEDGGRSWAQKGVVPNQQIVSIINHAAFNSENIDHIVVSKARELWVSMDGGLTWMPGEGFVDEWTGANIVSSEISSLDGSFVWAYALDLTVLPDLTSTNKKGLFVSFDGGLTFSLEIDASPSGDITLDQNAIYRPSPYESGVLIGLHTETADTPCTVVMYKYDTVTKVLTTESSSTLPSAGSLEFSPASDITVFVGVERRALCPAGQ